MIFKNTKLTIDGEALPKIQILNNFEGCTSPTAAIETALALILREVYDNINTYRDLAEGKRRIKFIYKGQNLTKWLREAMAHHSLIVFSEEIDDKNALYAFPDWVSPLKMASILKEKQILFEYLEPEDILISNTRGEYEKAETELLQVAAEDLRPEDGTYYAEDRLSPLESALASVRR